MDMICKRERRKGVVCIFALLIILLLSYVYYQSNGRVVDHLYALSAISAGLVLCLFLLLKAVTYFISAYTPEKLKFYRLSPISVVSGVLVSVSVLLFVGVLGIQFFNTDVFFPYVQTSYTFIDEAQDEAQVQVEVNKQFVIGNVGAYEGVFSVVDNNTTTKEASGNFIFFHGLSSRCARRQIQNLQHEQRIWIQNDTQTPQIKETNGIHVEYDTSIDGIVSVVCWKENQALAVTYRMEVENTVTTAAIVNDIVQDFEKNIGRWDE